MTAQEVTTDPDLAASRERIAAHLVGRERELELALAAVAAGRDLVLEGPPGTSKTTMLGAIAAEWGIPLLFVEGNADLTPAKLVGHHNPARVLREDYSADNFVPGPLVEAMQSGGFLYIEEFNRAPEDTLNALLTAMADRAVTVPRVGRIGALPTFRVIASMNPYDNVGTTRLSTSVHDRLNRLAVGYQDAPAEERIVELRSGATGPLAERLVRDAVAVTRATREHPDVRQGSSVRGAIDLTLVALRLAELRDVTEPEADGYPALVLDGMIVALSGRIHVDEAAETTPERVLRAMAEARFLLAPPPAAPGCSRAEADPPLRSRPAGAPAPRPPRSPPPPRAHPPPHYALGGGAPGPLRPSPASAPPSRGRGRPGGQAGAFTDERGSVVPAELDAVEPDPLVRARARQIAARLSMPRPRTGATVRGGAGLLGSLPYRGGSDDIDLDRTIEVLAERPVPEDEDIVVRDRVRARRAVVLAIDVSGSMRGERVRTAAATVGALSAELAHEALAVVAFWSDAAVLLHLGDPVSPGDVLDGLLRIPARGLTNVGFPLELAQRELGRVPVRDARVLLLSDCVHNAGPDPRPIAARLPRLDVLLDASGEKDVELGRELAARGRGVLEVVRGHRDVAPALERIFAG